ncbi:hypothetical protein [Verrucomicrobium spinosum]|uniref:hypothetical protein n=1 Tax=Verrucomicrobium spinosum TaxID=2736 RepID=UPI0012E10BAD|nr:hypothetical protein [Verrucomicrobium spinosum]
MKLARSALFLGLCVTVTARGAETARGASSPDDNGGMPQPLKQELFEGLLANPPFTRSLGLSDTLILTGVARFDSEVFATLLDTKTMESQVVSQKPIGKAGNLLASAAIPPDAHLVGQDPDQGGRGRGDPLWEAATQAQTPIGGGGGFGGGPGGSPAPLSPSEQAEAKQAAVNYREGFSSDGYPRQPPPEMVEKLSRMSVEQREAINREMIGIRNRGMSMEERRRIYEDMVNRTSRGGR